MEALALFSFAASQDHQISFQKGDVVKVTEMEEDSCWLTAEVEGRRGYVPENYISLLPHPWFAGGLSRQQAERRLLWQESGAFLVRDSESAPGDFSVSVSYGDRVEHFRVLEGGGQYCIWDHTFCSLNRLVDFYRTHSIAADKVVVLRGSPSDTPPPSGSRNPYPNPYRTASLESLHGPHPLRESSSVQLLEQLLGKPRLAHALCDYAPPHTAHLHFLRGDVIDLLDCSGSRCWRGRCRGRVGVFPPQCVQPLYH
ncbi:GRB2-related adapter protein-like [Nerophis lumbriciformis]|uniref:GRB2-related adapter protein-like n=1 Tax=Nerophis lumbriciformis TaxID=546530 RepID=UPI003BAD30D9